MTTPGEFPLSLKAAIDALCKAQVDCEYEAGLQAELEAARTVLLDEIRAYGSARAASVVDSLDNWD